MIKETEKYPARKRWCLPDLSLRNSQATVDPGNSDRNYKQIETQTKFVHTLVDDDISISTSSCTIQCRLSWKTRIHGRIQCAVDDSWFLSPTDRALACIYPKTVVGGGHRKPISRLLRLTFIKMIFTGILPQPRPSDQHSTDICSSSSRARIRAQWLCADDNIW